MHIVVPSHKRAGHVITHKMVSNAIVCIPKSQESEYREKQPELELVAHPDSIIGISKKRNWMLKKFGDILQLDDDIISLKRMYVAPDMKNDKFTPDQVYGIVSDVHHMLKDYGRIKMYGFAKSASPLHYNVSKPIGLTGFIYTVLGFIHGNELEFPMIDKMVGEDDYICLLNAYKHRMIWIDNRFYWHKLVSNYNIGGCEDIRNDETELESYRVLKKNFGEAVVLSDKERAISKCKIPF